MVEPVEAQKERSETKERTLGMTCRVCGWQSSVTGTEDALAMLDRLEAAHSLLRPVCPAAKGPTRG